MNANIADFVELLRKLNQDRIDEMMMRNMNRPIEKSMPTPVDFNFPYEPYPDQISFMESLYKVVEQNKQGIFESPTGTGKTMSILCGLLRWLRDHEDRSRNIITDERSDIERKLAELSKTSDSSDWFNNQAQENMLKKRLDVLKKDYCKIELFDKKLSDIINKKEYHKKGMGKPRHPLIPSAEDANHENQDIVDPDSEFLLEDYDVGKSDTILEDENYDDFKPTQVFICSRTHSQLAQFVDELKKSSFGNNARIVTLASRQSTCICPSVRKLGNNASINERCLEMQKSSGAKKPNPTDQVGLKRKRVATVGKCIFYSQDLVEDLAKLALCEPQDIEDLVNTGKKLRACPYYASRSASKLAQIILAPYNTILHKETREANGIDLKNSVLIVDEAHNLLDALCAMNGVVLFEDHIHNSIYQLSAYKQYYNSKLSAANLRIFYQMDRALKGMRDFLAGVTESAVYKTASFQDKADISYLNIYSLSMQINQTYLIRKVQGFAKSKPHLVEEIAQSLEAKKLTKTKKPVNVGNPITDVIPTVGVSSFLSSISATPKSARLNRTDHLKPPDIEVNPSRVAAASLHTILAFMQALTSNEESSRILVHCNKANEHDKYSKRSLEYLVLDPSQQFAGIVKDCRSVIVAGGTMKPIEEMKQRLFINAGAKPEDIQDCICGHIIPPDNILPIIIYNAVQTAVRFDFQNRNKMFSVIKQVLNQYCNSKKVLGGIVVFFTSYQYMNWVWEQIKGDAYERPLFVESQETGSVSRTLDGYVSAIRQNPKRGAMIFCVMGGKLSEGINFKDELGRLVILFGLPYPYQDSIEYKEKLSFIQHTEGAKAAKGMGLTMCMKTVNQCIGRAIRHKEDFASVLLVDERYKQTEVQALLPNWILSQLQQHNSDIAFSLVSDYFSGRGNLMAKH